MCVGPLWVVWVCDLGVDQYTFMICEHPSFHCHSELCEFIVIDKIVYLLTRSPLYWPFIVLSFC